MVLRAAAILIAALLSAGGTAPAFAFGEGGCGAGPCSDCHTLDRQEAEQILTGLVETVHGVEFALVPGLWKVDVENKGQSGTLYIDFSKSFVISGRVLRLSDWADVSTGKAPEQRRADVSRIPLDQALVLGSRDAPIKVVVFTDPQCPYCAKLHEELKKVVAQRGDIAFLLALFPLKSHPDAYRISRSIVCAGSVELLEDSYGGEEIPDPTCESGAVDRWLETGAEFGIRSTPTLVLPDGTVLSGFKPAEKILELLGKTPPPP